MSNTSSRNGSANSHYAKNLYKFYSEDKSQFNKYRKLEEKDYSMFLSKKGMIQKMSITQQLSELADKCDRKINKNLSEGMPNEVTLPFNSIEITTKSGEKLAIIGEDLEQSLQYISPKGWPPLISELMKFQEELHHPPPLPRDLLVTNGTHHGLQLCTDILVDPGDPVIATEYSYIGLHAILQQYQVEYLGIPEDKEGLIPEVLETVLKERLSQGLKMPRVMYLIPTVSNPTGYLMSEERKRKIYEMACKYNLIIVEDEVYMYLNYTDTVPPSFLSLDASGRVLRVESLSKVAAAGLRAGWLLGPRALVRRAQHAATVGIIHPCALAQVILHRLIVDRESLTTQLLSTREFYKKQRDAVTKALKAIGDLIEWEEPAGGYYIWIKIRGLEDVRNMVFNTAFKHGLMLESGHGFAYNERPCPYIRLTFTKIDIDKLDGDVRIIGDIIREEKKLLERKSGSG